jgi:hypothetical protein
MSVVLVVMGIAHLLGVFQVPPSSPTAGVAVAMMVGLSSSGSGGAVVALRETLAPEEPTPEAWEAPVQEMPGADGASLGAASIEVDGTGPIPSDDTEGSLRDLVMRGANIGVARGAALGDVAPAPGPSGATGPGVS